MKQLYKTIGFLAALVLPSLGFSASITVGQSLSALSGNDVEECVIEGDEVVLKPWNSSQLNGKVQVVEYMAARAGVDKVNENFFNALKTSGMDEQVGMAKLVNSDDALWGTSGMVAVEMKKNKKKTPELTMVIDSEGVGQQQWDLEKKGVALMILDPRGEVLFFKEGQLSSDDIRTALAKIRAQLGLASNP